MANEINKQRLNAILDEAQRSGKLGAEADQLRAALNSGSFDQALRNLKPEDSQKIQQVMNNREAVERLLNSPQAQQILKKILDK